MRASIVITNSTTPAASRRWPVVLLVELTGIDSARSAKAARSPRVSAPSLYLVPVPWALT